MPVFRCTAVALTLAAAVSLEAATLDVLSFNVWHSDTGGAASRANIVETIKASRADLVGLQELNSASDGEAIRQGLGEGWYFHHVSDLGFFSRYPITAVSSQRLGVRLEVEGRPVWFFNAHLAHAPYGPYQLAGISYNGGPLRDPNSAAGIAAVIDDQRNRLAEARNYLEDMRQSGALGGDGAILVGDFNEPSHLDWTQRAKAAGLKRAIVPWSVSKAFVEAGFLDSYRSVYADEVAEPAYTWSPLLGPGYRESHYPAGVTEPQDRIDLIYHRGGLRVLDAAMVGPQGDGLSRIQYGQGISSSQAGRFPSDHRGVWVRLQIDGTEPPASTRLTFAGLAHNPGNDRALNQGYGDRSAATPNVSVRFQGSGGALWDTYDSARDGSGEANWRGGVAQLQDGGAGRFHELVLTPDAGYGVTIDRFRLLDYQRWAGGHSVVWSVRNAQGATLASGTASVPVDGAVTVETGLRSLQQQELTLRLEQVSGNSADLAIDDVEFRQR